MSLHFYKILHVFLAILISSLLSLAFFSENKKWVKISSGILSLLLVVSGFGLMAKLGFNEPAYWPVWLKVKMAIWLCVAAGAPVLAKRLKAPKSRAFAYWGFMLLFLAAVVLGVVKP